MNKRERILHLAHEGNLPDDYIPAAFFLHFPQEAHSGRAAVMKHIDYFRATGNDIVKIQYEHRYPLLDSIRSAQDWTSMPCYDESFYADQLEVVAGVAAELKAEAVIIVTLYSPFMFASHTVGKDALLRHFADDPAAVRKGLDTIVESMGHFIRGCIERGADGFYASTQGGEKGRLAPDVFEQYVMPTDLAIWEMLKQKTELNILHVCDYAGPYESFERYTRYPGQIVSAPTEVAGKQIPGRAVAELFNRPFLGGMERLGIISTGPANAVPEAARKTIEQGPRAMILGADCTLTAETDWQNIAAATSVAHAGGR